MLQTFVARLAVIIVPGEVRALMKTSALAQLALSFPDWKWIRDAVTLVVPAVVTWVVKRIIDQ
jgi:hypothetical protein